ncbi:neuropeptides capa receptor-like [Antedon mediterranea]|uniref:neuropeptides capa receptor-like n=1 Tax=Antedon mediterranea TaxID=105859 RepID=UPI003AF81E48
MENNKNTSEVIDWQEVMEPYLYGDVDAYAMFVAVPIIVIIGVFGNISTIIVLSTNPRMRNSLNIYLVNLAISDCLFLLVAPTFTWITFFESPLNHHYDNSWFTVGYCKFYTFIVHSAYQQSCNFIIAIAVERVLATSYPLKYRAYVSKKRTLKICGTLWVFTLFYQSRNIVTIGESSLEFPWPDMTNGVTNSTTICTLCVDFHKTVCKTMNDLYVLDLSFVLFAIIFIIIMYGTLFSSFLGPKSKKEVTSTASNRVNYETKALRTVVITISAYSFLTAPLNMLLLLENFNLVNPDVVGFIENVFRFIALINSANNPIIYNLSNETYRQAFWKLFGFSKEKKTHTKTDKISVPNRTVFESISA